MPGWGTHADCEPDKGHLARLGIRNLNQPCAGLPRAGGDERLATVHTPEGMPLPQTP
jgi:hypothetical protein